ncbi:MAG: RNA-guided endonuclease InsQ/TnpB family protein, partial [Candidatus Saccharimonadales bacterium]
MLQSIKYRPYPSQKQQDLLARHFGCVRLVYNWALELKSALYKDSKTKISRFELQVKLKEMKADLPFLKEINSQSLQVAILYLERAFTNFFQGRAAYPRFKRKFARQSFHCPQHIRVAAGKVFIPKFTEGIPVRIHRSFAGEIRNATISKTSSGKYYVSILVETGREAKPRCPVKRETAVGIDVGLKSFAVLSDGTEIENPKYLKKRMERIKVLQRRKDRKQKGSANRKKACRKLARQQEKVANQRMDFQHKTSTAITKQWETVCVEELAIGNMMKNHCLAGSISDAGWGMFKAMLQYKMEREGKWLLKAGRFDPSSKRHYECGYVYKELSLGEREWICPGCGKLVLRDVNGAVNIKVYALERYFALMRLTGVE